ncbi:MAG: sugar ABC transporter permease, partial [Limnochordia bacterium]
MRIRRLRMSFERRKVVAGYLFCLPFILGFVLFFLVSFVRTILFSFNELTLTPEGFSLTFVGLANYHYALNVHPSFPMDLLTEIGNLFMEVPLILAFSFFTALVLNQRFIGRLTARTILFLPVILAAGVIFRLEEKDMITQLSMGAAQPGLVFSGAALQNLLFSTRLPEALLNFVLTAVESIPEIIRASGIQVLIFLAGLQSIPRSIYEAADVEGATAWENFWLITLPMLSPLILTTVVYSIIDSFTSADNALVAMIRSTAFVGQGFGLSAAMSTVYFAAIFAILGLTIAVVSRWVLY